MTRGRPKHPDILTPREWEVLSLLRNGRSNREIAEALGISFDGARYHVSEILSKLGVSSREEAAAWRPEAAVRRFAPAGLLAGLKTATGGSGAVMAAAVVVSGTVAALALFALGVFSMSERSDSRPLDTPRFYYSTEVRATSAGSRQWPTRAIVSYDVTRDRSETLLEYGGVDDFPVKEVLGREHLFVATESRVSRAALDGSGAAELYRRPGAGMITDIAVSPDGSMLAVVTDPLLFLDAATGDEILRIDLQDSRFDGFIGSMWKVRWRDDGFGVVVSASTSSSRPGGRATIMLDGRITVHEQEGYANLARSAKRLADGAGAICGDLISGHQLRLRDLDSDASLATVTDAAKVFTPWAWSLQDDELLYQERDWRQDGTCGSEVRWRVLRVGPPGSSEPVPDLDQLLARWHGERLVELICAGDQNMPRAVLPDRWADERSGCFGIEGAGELRLAGKKIGNVRDVFVLGFDGF